MVDAGQETAGGADLVGGPRPRDWLACGWFTPDYRPLAETLAAQLAAHDVPHHIFSTTKIGNWSREVLRKPSMIQRAMREHPDKVIIFMDVDCIVRGPLDEAAVTTADVTCSLYVKKQFGRLRADLSSRVVVIRPSASARRLVEHWALACQEANSIMPDLGDETALMVSLARCTGAAWSAIDQRFAGRELARAPKGAVIVHDSAHEESTVVRRVHKQAKAWKRWAFGSTTRDLAVK